MTYHQFAQKLLVNGFTRVERDDRLLDIFPDQVRLKGIELWEYWNSPQVLIIRLSLPFNPKKVKLFTIPQKRIEDLLHKNKTASLEKFKPLNPQQVS